MADMQAARVKMKALESSVDAITDGMVKVISHPQTGFIKLMQGVTDVFKVANPITGQIADTFMSLVTRSTVFQSNMAALDTQVQATADSFMMHLQPVFDDLLTAFSNPDLREAMDNLGERFGDLYEAIRPLVQEEIKEFTDLLLATFGIVNDGTEAWDKLKIALVTITAIITEMNNSWERMGEGIANWWATVVEGWNNFWSQASPPPQNTWGGI